MGEGYSDFYLFFMVHIPKNEWPTSCPFEKDGVTPTGDGSCNGSAQGEYSEGQPYAWFSSWKFNTFNLDCPSAICPDRQTYSDKWNMLVAMKQYNYGETPGIHMIYEARGLDNEWALNGSHIDNLLGDWFGIEYHVTISGDTATFTSWIYDKEGNSFVNADGLTWTLPAKAIGTKWNQFLFGGNNSNTFSWGPTMQSAYYVDDLIIDDKRIGPKYFSLINQSSLALPPTNLSGKLLK
jgi:hypothetical protein